jgi:serine kinase of HPr protein (carbohydrate metabolism regulator)
VNNIHATLISFNNAGVLFIGKSGSGKSDLALRMIMEKGAVLVADDRVDLSVINNNLYGSAPKELYGKMEIRGLGITNFTAKKREKIVLCVELAENREEVERMPVPENITFLGVSITKIKLYPFDCSTICKIIAKISSIIS